MTSVAAAGVVGILATSMSAPDVFRQTEEPFARSAEIYRPGYHPHYLVEDDLPGWQAAHARGTRQGGPGGAAGAEMYAGGPSRFFFMLQPFTDSEEALGVDI